MILFFFFSSRRRHTRYWRDWSSDVCSSDLPRWTWSACRTRRNSGNGSRQRSEEHTSELQSRQYLVCRLLLEKKKTQRHDASQSLEQNHVDMQTQKNRVVTH